MITVGEREAGPESAAEGDALPFSGGGTSMPEAEHSPLFTDGGSTLGPGDGSALTQNLQPGTSMTVMKRKSNYS